MVDLEHFDHPDETEECEVKYLWEEKCQNDKDRDKWIWAEKRFVWDVDIDRAEEKLDEEDDTEGKLDLVHDFQRRFMNKNPREAVHNLHASEKEQEETDDHEKLIQNEVLAVARVKRAVDCVENFLDFHSV